MSGLRIGDEVLAMDPATGRLAFRSIYLFGHQDAEAEGTMVNIEARPLPPRVGAPAAAALPGNSSAPLRLRLSPQHYLPVCMRGGCGAPRLPGLIEGVLDAALGSSSSSGGWQHSYAQDVQPGMRVLVAAPGSTGGSDGSSGGDGSGSSGTLGTLQQAVVTRVWLSTERGLYNPFVHVSGLSGSAWHCSGLVGGSQLVLGLWKAAWGREQAASQRGRCPLAVPASALPPPRLLPPRHPMASEFNTSSACCAFIPLHCAANVGSGHFLPSTSLIRPLGPCAPPHAPRPMPHGPTPAPTFPLPCLPPSRAATCLWMECLRATSRNGYSMTLSRQPGGGTCPPCMRHSCWLGGWPTACWAPSSLPRWMQPASSPLLDAEPARSSALPLPWSALGWQRCRLGRRPLQPPPPASWHRGSRWHARPGAAEPLLQHLMRAAPAPLSLLLNTASPLFCARPC